MNKLNKTDQAARRKLAQLLMLQNESIQSEAAQKLPQTDNPTSPKGSYQAIARELEGKGSSFPTGGGE